MFNLIIDSAAGLTTKPQGADNSSINLFSLATAPPVCVKIVFHLIRMQFSSCISITEVRESVRLIPRPWPCLESLPDQWPLLRTGRIVSHKEEGRSKNNSASSSHSSSKSYCWLSQILRINTRCSLSLALCVNVAKRSNATVSSIRVLRPRGCVSPDTAI